MGVRNKNITDSRDGPVVRRLNSLSNVLEPVGYLHAKLARKSVMHERRHMDHKFLPRTCIVESNNSLVKAYITVFIEIMCGLTEVCHEPSREGLHHLL
jgi:hypothetical protein